MSKITVDVDGVEEVIDSLGNLLDYEKLDRALGRACALVEGEAKKKAPKGNGELRRSITSKVQNHEGIVYTPLEYAPYVEYGTGLFAVEGGRQDVPWSYKDDEGNWHSTYGMHPQPYMHPALAENRLEVIRIIREGIVND